MITVTSAHLAGMRLSPTPRRFSAPHRSALAAALGLALAGPAAATSFSVLSGANLTTGQTLGPAAGELGSIANGGTLSLGGGTTAVTISGNNATLNNFGSVLQTGTGRAVRDNTGVTGLVVNNGSATFTSALMRTSNADVLQMNQAVGGVTLTNFGQIISLNTSAGGNQAIDFNAVSSSANLINNEASGVIRATEADAVRPGVNGQVNNRGLIESITPTASGSDAIDGQNNNGIEIVNFSGGQINGGRNGITGGQASAATSHNARIQNNAGATISGLNGAGLNFDGFNNLQLVTVVNAGLIVGTGITADGDGVDIDGPVHLTNTGTIRSSNAFSAVAAGLAFSEALSVGGGTITNSGLIEGLVALGNTNAVGRGISLVGNDITAGPNTGQREAIYSNALVVNQSGGVIRGDSDSALFAGGLSGSGRTVEIRNEAGAQLRGGGTTSAAVVVASDYGVTIFNAGLIDGSSSGKALALGSGLNTVTIQGGAASVLGSMDGGSGGNNTLRLTPGAGQSFNYGGAVLNFATVSVESGTVRFTGASSYTGTTRIAAGATLVLDGLNRLAAASSLQLQGGRLALLNAAGQSANSFAALSVQGASAIDLGGATLSFATLAGWSPGASLALTGYTGANGYALRFNGNVLGDAGLQQLVAGTTVNSQQALATFDGQFTNITAVPEPSALTLMLVGALALAARARAQRQSR